ncbi:hypothetical protein HNQ77_000286 [Silvibacterium bohemicum]|uniref:Uncharacterized protein n=1 Tax=Silvibacterium bohemicum TaxID=1577686 RepID=A0A841JV89_9BACT|nr:hypothetical protein [Silvibacterium bohemicum]MBB6142348.1 hypothetical protein [Silvibacterium bohemicum]
MSTLKHDVCQISARLPAAIAALLSVGLVLAASGCAKHEAPVQPVAQPQAPITKPAPATPIDAKKVELGGATWDPQWDAIVEKALPGEMLSTAVPRDVRRFCPRFYGMSEVDKRAFWAYFFQALAGAEAGLDPDTRVRHTDPAVAVIDPVTHRAVRSEGLLQLTYEDQQRYGCDFNWDADKNLPPKDPAKTILQPKNNLECGVKILDHQMIDQHKGVVSRTSYWSTLQPGTISYRVFVKQMANPPLACGLATNTRRVARVASKTQSRETAIR